MTCRGCASQNCCNHNCRKKMQFVFGSCRKNPLKYCHFTHQNALFEKNNFATFVSTFDRPPSCPRIPIKQVINLNISKFYISNVPRIKQSEKNFIRNLCSKMLFYPSNVLLVLLLLSPTSIAKLKTRKGYRDTL